MFPKQHKLPVRVFWILAHMPAWRNLV